MSLATKNVASVLVGSVLVLALSFAVATPAKADMLSDLQAQVQALLAQIAALSGGSTSTGGGCYAFTMTHQMGSTGGEVMEIQKFLNSHGAQVAASGAGSPGNESSYYGALTRAAVAKWQAANGVSPAAGYWGPVTRAKVAQVCASMPGTPGTPGTPTTPGTSGLNGTAGTATITSTSEDVEDEVLSGTTEKIVGFKVEASGSDLRVTNIRVRFDKDSAAESASSDMLSSIFSEISIWAGGSKIGSMAASAFSRDAAGVYSASIPVDMIVRMGSANKVTFHVGATANSSLDSDDDGSANDWLVQVTQVRYTDASGAVLFEDPNATVNNGGATAITTTTSGVYANRLSSSSDVTLRMGEGSGNPKAGNVEVSESNSSDVTLLEFTLKAEGADMYFDRLVASTTATGVNQVSDIVQTFFLMRGSTRIAEVTGATATQTFQIVSFSLDDIETITSGSTQTYRIVAKVNSISTTPSATEFSNGDSLSASTSPAVVDINARVVSDGKSVTDRSGSVTNYTQTMYSEGIQITKVSESFTHNPQDTSANSTGEFKVTLRVTNFGDDDVYVPLSAVATTTYAGGFTEGVAFTVYNGSAATSTGATGVLARVSGGTELTNSVRISGGSSADLMLTATHNPGLGNNTGLWRAEVKGVGTATTDSATATTVTDTVPVEDFRTNYSTINN